MVEFKLVINDVKTGKSYQKTIAGSQTDIFKGKKLKDKINGKEIGFDGYEFIITGGSDKQGFPLRFDLPTRERKRVMITHGPGAKTERKGDRIRKTVRGNVLSTEVSQINLKVEKYGVKSIPETLGIKEEKKEDKKVESKKETKPESKKEEKKEEVKEPEKKPEVKPEVKKDEKTGKKEK